MTLSLRLLCVAGLTLVAVVSLPTPVAELVDPEDPEVQACAAFALETLGSRDKDHQYSISRVVAVTMEPIGGGQYDMDVEVKKVPCAPEAENPCSPRTADEQTLLQCKFVVLTAPWKQQRVLLSTSCEKDQSLN